MNSAHQIYVKGESTPAQYKYVYSDHKLNTITVWQYHNFLRYIIYFIVKPNVQNIIVQVLLDMFSEKLKRQQKILQPEESAPASPPLKQLVQPLEPVENVTANTPRKCIATVLPSMVGRQRTNTTTTTVRMRRIGAPSPRSTRTATITSTRASGTADPEIATTSNTAADQTRDFELSGTCTEIMISLIY